ICTDKTGTLTRNEMTVQRIVCDGRGFEVGGVGYAPVGAVLDGGREVDLASEPALALAIRTGVLCNDSSLRQEGDLWFVDGDPTEGALLVLGAKTGLHAQACAAQWPRLGVIPFES